MDESNAFSTHVTKKKQVIIWWGGGGGGCRLKEASDSMCPEHVVNLSTTILSLCAGNYGNYSQCHSNVVLDEITEQQNGLLCRYKRKAELSQMTQPCSSFLILGISSHCQKLVFLSPCTHHCVPLIFLKKY